MLWPQQLAYVGEPTGYGGGHRHRRAQEMGAGPLSLPSDEIAIGRGGAAVTRGHQIAVHADAHRTAGLAPFESGAAEDAVQPLGFGLGFHQAGTGHHHGWHNGAPTVRDLRRGT